MISVIFSFGNEKVLINVQGHNVYFGSTEFGAQLAPIEGLKLSKAGVLKEFPELTDDKNWRGKAITKFKKKILELKTETDVADYIIEDLKKFGYKPEFKQRDGFRPQLIK